MLTTREILALAAVGGSALAVSGCGGSGRGAAETNGRVAIEVGKAGCVSSAVQLGAGPATFRVHVEDGNSVGELELVRRPVVLAEIENLPATATDYRFSLQLTPGPILLYCPGGTATRTVLRVTGKAPVATSPRAAAAVAQYRTWVEGQTRELVNSTESFVAALRAGDLAQAKLRYSVAHAYYERVEPIAESFSALDKAIDARANDVPASRWTGFHPLEQRLWIDGTTKGTGALAAKLVADVTAVGAVATRLTLTPAQIANGSVSLLDEVASTKITGEEERYSHLDLVDFEANVTGADEAFAAVRPLLPPRSAELGRTIAARFAAVDKALDRYRRGDGFVTYTALRPRDTRFLSRVVDALAEPLSNVSALVVRSR